MLSTLLLNMVPFGIAVLNARSKILFSNSSATELLDECSDLWAQDGHLNARSVAHGRALLEAIQQLAQSAEPEPAALCIGRSNKRPLFIVLARLPVHGKPLKPRNVRIVAIISDPHRDLRPNPRLIRKLFEFTPVQAEIASLMMESVDTAGIAQELKVTRNTLRDHLKVMFQRVNARNQSELTHTLLRSPACFRLPTEIEKRSN